MYQILHWANKFIIVLRGGGKNCYHAAVFLFNWISRKWGTIDKILISFSVFNFFPILTKVKTISSAFSNLRLQGWSQHPVLYCEGSWLAFPPASKRLTRELCLHLYIVSLDLVKYKSKVTAVNHKCSDPLHPVVLAGIVLCLHRGFSHTLSWNCSVGFVWWAGSWGSSTARSSELTWCVRVVPLYCFRS